jgi:hypothetical protein
MGPTTVVGQAHRVIPAGRCRHQDADVFIFIGSTADNNTIYAGLKEEVKLKGWVTFYASEDCTLHFDNKNVFGENLYPLKSGSNPLQTVERGDTSYAINHSPRSGPIIHVP